MGNPSLSWIDRANWSGLVGRATGDGGTASKTAWRTLQSTPARVAVRAPNPVAVHTASAALARPVSVPPEMYVAPFVPPLDGGLEQNLQALVAWIDESLQCRAAFIADDNGLPVVESAHAEQGHMAATSTILLLLGSIRSLMGDMGRWLSLRTASGVLSFMEVDTPWGRFGVGVLTDGALPPEVQPELERAVLRAFAE